MSIMALAKKGYGTIADIEAMDTPQFLDLVEYEHICCDIEWHMLEHK